MAQNSTTAESRAQSFRPVENVEMQSGEKLLVEAYAAIWVLVFILVVLSWLRLKKLNERIDVIERALNKKAGSDA